MNHLGNNENEGYKYNEDFLNRRSTALFITIPQTNINYKELHQEITKYNQVIYVLSKKESHKDMGEHIHILVKFKQQVKTKSIHKIIMGMEGNIKGSVNYQPPKNISKCISYLFKEETACEPPIEYGERPAPQGRPKLDSKEIEYSTAITLAEEGQLEEALDHLKAIDPRDYLKFKDTFKENLKTENKIRKYYELPDYSKAKLSTTQQTVWNILNEPPKARRIIWVSGHYGSGKSFLYQYIKSNHEYEMYDAGQSASLDNVAYGYDQEGVIAWDLPRTFDWEEKGDHIANVIEKFSDFGQSITSKKYKGKTQQVRGHCIVFSNSPPIEQLGHRDIIHINLTKNKCNPENKITEEYKNDILPIKNIIEPQETRTNHSEKHSKIYEEESDEEKYHDDLIYESDSEDEIETFLIKKQTIENHIETLTRNGITKFKINIKTDGINRTHILKSLEEAKNLYEESKSHLEKVE